MVWGVIKWLLLVKREQSNKVALCFMLWYITSVKIPYGLGVVLCKRKK